MQTPVNVAKFHGLKAFLKILLCVVLVVSLCPPMTGAFADEPQNAATADVKSTADQDEADTAKADKAGKADEKKAAEEESDKEKAANEDTSEATADEGATEDEGQSGEGASTAAGDESSAAEADDQEADFQEASESEDATEATESESATDEEAVEGEGEVAAEEAEQAAEEEEKAKDGEPTVLTAKAEGIKATLTVDAKAELPEDAKLVVTPLVKHDAEEATEGDDQAQAAEGEAAANGEATQDADAATKAEEDKTVTGADVVLQGMQDAVDAYVDKQADSDKAAKADKKEEAAEGKAEGAAEGTAEEETKTVVADAFAVELLDADGATLSVDKEQARLTIELTDAKIVAEYENVYSVERNEPSKNDDAAKAAALEKPVSEVAEEEYADADKAAKEIQFDGTAEEVTKEVKADEKTEVSTVEFEGVQSLVALKAVKAVSPGGPLKAAGPTTRDELPYKEKLMEEGKTYTVNGHQIRLYDTQSNNINMNLFDYDATDIAPVGATHHDNDNEYGNVYFNVVNKNGQNTIEDINYKGNNPVGDAVNHNHNTDNGRAHQLQFYSHGSIGDATHNPGNDINQFAGYTSGSYYGSTPWDWDYKQQYANQGIVQSTLVGGYPKINRNDGESLDYLFSPTVDHVGKTTYENVNKLFYEDLTTHRLEYDSNYHYAYYCKGDGEFAVYQDTYNRESNTGMKVGFFPFDKYTGKDNTKINPTSGTPIDVTHHFGLTMTTQITMPYEGKIPVEGSSTPEDMVFDFSGDDDMWVFIDGRLVLDVGGIHQPVSGQINFATGKVTISSGTVNPVNNANYTAPNDPYKNNYYRVSSGTNATSDNVLTDHADLWKALDLSEPWRAGTTHTVQVFYLERGGCDSNLKISTNIHLMTLKNAAVQKVWEPSSDAKPITVDLVRKAIPRDSTKTLKPEHAYTYIGTTTLDGNGEYQYSWSNLKSQGYTTDDSSDPDYSVYCDFEYYVVEPKIDGHVTAYSSADGSPLKEETVTYTKEGKEIKNAGAASATFAKIVVTNSRESKLHVEKRWSDGESKHTGDSVYVQLYKNGVAVGDPVKLENGAWTHDYTFAPEQDAEYTFKEGVLEGSTFKPKTTFELNGKQYKQESIVYKDANHATRESNLDGNAWPDAGTATITNATIEANVKLLKVDAVDGTTPLKGATFVVVKDGANPDAYSETDDTALICKPGTEETDFTTGYDGIIEVEGLAPGTYWFKETVAPTGFQNAYSNTPIKAVVNADGTVQLISGDGKTSPKLELQGDVYTLTAPNSRVYNLPSTGGPGEFSFLFAGAFIMALTMGLARMRRKPGEWETAQYPVTTGGR